MLYKSMLKSKLAEKHLLPPHAVKYVCEEYGIILDEKQFP